MSNLVAADWYLQWQIMVISKFSEINWKNWSSLYSLDPGLADMEATNVAELQNNH